jgi:hypothetical protein
VSFSLKDVLKEVPRKPDRGSPHQIDERARGSQSQQRVSLYRREDNPLQLRNPIKGLIIGYDALIHS